MTIINLLLAICLLLAALIVVVIRTRSTDTKVTLDGNVDEAIEKLGKAVQQHVEVNAVLALTEKFKGDPDLIAKLRTYSDQTVAAVMLMRVNNISNDLRVAQDNLSVQRANKARGGTNIYDDRIKVIERMIGNLMNELNEVDMIVQKLGVALS